VDKKSLRIWAKTEREKLNTEKLSSKIIANIVNMPEYKSSKNIMIFYPLKNEINLLGLLKDKSKKFYLPKIEGENLLCCPYSKGDETCISCFHTCEPTTKPCPKTNIDLVIVPALACDKNGYRLGYGGGFYDRFLKDFDGIKISCVPKELVIDTIYPKEYDIKMDIIVTE
jgi:5-formyltetrahydrofolate cyclo-ligase